MNTRRAGPLGAAWRLATTGSRRQAAVGHGGVGGGHQYTGVEGCSVTKALLPHHLGSHPSLHLARWPKQIAAGLCG